MVDPDTSHIIVAMNSITMIQSWYSLRQKITLLLVRRCSLLVHHLVHQ